jgi:hypothetical protein
VWGSHINGHEPNKPEFSSFADVNVLLIFSFQVGPVISVQPLKVFHFS